MARITTGERLVKIETSLDYLTERIDHIADALEKHVAWESQKYDDLHAVFASKWVEKGIIAVGIAIIAFLIQQIIMRV